MPPDISNVSDQDLVASACEGREDAFAELLRRYRPSVYDFTHRLVRDHDLAEDLTQEVFVKAFGTLESHRPESSFSSWILKIANNHTVAHLRREQRLRHRRLDTVPLEPTPDATNPRSVAANRFRVALSNTPTPTPRDTHPFGPALDEALGRLKEHHRLCFVLREIEGRSYDDIADILDMPVGSVGPWLTRARRELRAALDPLRDTLQASSLTPA